MEVCGPSMSLCGSSCALIGAQIGGVRLGGVSTFKPRPIQDLE